MKGSLNVLRTIHIGLMAGPTFFAAMVLLITSPGESSSEIEALNYLSPAYFFITIVAQNIAFKSYLKQNYSVEANMQQKMATFQTAHIIRMALMEGSALLAVVTTLLNAEFLHLIPFALILVLMFTKLPNTFLIERELQLSPEEKNQLTEA